MLKDGKRFSKRKKTKKQVGIVILISDKIDFKAKLARRDREGHYIIPTGKIHIEDIVILNMYAPSTKGLPYI